MRGIEHIPWVYDTFFWFYERIGFDRWRNWLVSGAKGRTLEVGVGTGRNLPRYAQSIPVVGMEPDRHALRKARRRTPHVPLVVGSAEALPFRDQAFDTVVSGLVFCSVSDPDAGLGEVRRVLAPGGQLRMIEHVRDTRPWAARLQDMGQPVWTAITGGCRPNRDTEAAVRRAGFVIGDDRKARGVMRRFSARPDR